jgi:hypothetical protein
LLEEDVSSFLTWSSKAVQSTKTPRGGSSKQALDR